MKQNVFLRPLFLILIFGLLFSCSPQKNQDETSENEALTKCLQSQLQITEKDSIAISNSLNPSIWKGIYNATNIEIFFTKKVSPDGETETFTVIFKKVNNCLKLERAYKFYDGKQTDVSAITEVMILNFDFQNWEVDQLFSGLISYIDPHDKEFYTRKFWVKLTPETPKNDPFVPLLFKNCLGNKLPLDIDLNKDGNIDFKLSYIEIKDTGNKPKFSYYTIQLISTNQTINKILSPITNKGPYFVVFEPPFNSQNTKQYLEEVKNELDVFYQFESPYEKYNYFLSNNLTYREILSNNLKDYFVVSMFINGKTHFGWIQFQLDSKNCSAKIVETYFHTTPNEAVFIN